MTMANWIDAMKKQETEKSHIEDAEEAVNLREFAKVYVIVIDGKLFWRALRSKKMAYDIRSLLKNVAPDVKCEVNETAFYPEDPNGY